MEIQVYHTLPEAARQIRQEVFVEEQHFQEEFDGIDGRALHLILYQDGVAAGTCRVFQGREPGEYLVGRIAVRKSFRGQNLGAALLEAAEQEIWKAGGQQRPASRPAESVGVFMRNRGTSPTDRWSTKSTVPISG